MIFRNWILENFPFIEDDFDGLTDYQLFCKVVGYMKKSLEKIAGFQETINEFTIKLDEFQHYFDNLDVTEEVNAKLDEMVEDGTMEQLIAQYLQLATTYTYNSVAEMKLAENLTNGCFTKTTGFYSNGDGGGAYYKVRTITNEDVINEMSLIALHDINLVAELIKVNVNVKQYGAKGNDTDDDTLAIQTCIDENILVNIPVGIYKTSNSINITHSNQKIYGEGTTLSYFKKYGTDSYSESVDYEEKTFDFSSYPSIVNLIFPEDNNISNVEIKNIGLVSNTNNANNGIIAPHISYCNFYRVRTNNCIKGIKIGGWINKIDNCDILANNDNGIEVVDGIYNVIEKTHCNNITTSNCKSTYITKCSLDNGNPCFRMLNSLYTAITETSTETNRYILQAQNSYVYVNGCNLETHSNQNLDLLNTYFQVSNNGKVHIENSYIHYDDYYDYGDPTNKGIIYVNTGELKLNDCKISIPYTYTKGISGSGGTIEFNDEVISSVANTTKKTGRFKITDGTSVEVLRLPFSYNKNYMLHIKSWNSGPYHTAINVDTVMTACSNAANTGLSSDVNYTVAKPPGNSYNSYLHLDYDSDNNELVLYYKSTNAYGNDVYFEIEYTNN